MQTLRAKSLFAALFACFAFVCCAEAASFELNNGGTNITNQILEIGETGLISSESILSTRTDGSPAIRVNAGGSAANRATITIESGSRLTTNAAGNDGENAIFALGAVMIDNAGIIDNPGGSTGGLITLSGRLSELLNTGIINAGSSNLPAILIDSDENTIINEADARILGVYGIRILRGADNAIQNSGTIETTHTALEIFTYTSSRVLVNVVDAAGKRVLLKDAKGNTITGIDGTTLYETRIVPSQSARPRLSSSGNPMNDNTGVPIYDIDESLASAADETSGVSRNTITNHRGSIARGVMYGLYIFGGSNEVSNDGALEGTDVISGIGILINSRNAEHTQATEQIHSITFSALNTITNTGSILGGKTGIHISGGFGNVISNDGGNIIGTSEYGILIHGLENEVNNSGIINSVSGEGIRIAPIDFLYASDKNTITNHAFGSIEGIANGIYITGAENEIDNSGQIAGSGFQSSGIFLKTVAVLTLDSLQAPGVLYYPADDNSITNHRTGAISGEQHGIYIEGFRNEVQNEGSIVGIAGYGIFLSKDIDPVFEITIYDDANQARMIDDGAGGMAPQTRNVHAANIKRRLDADGDPLSDADGNPIYDLRHSSVYAPEGDYEAGENRVTNRLGGRIRGQLSGIKITSPGNEIRNHGVISGTDAYGLEIESNDNTIFNGAGAGITGGLRAIKLTKLGNTITNRGFLISGSDIAISSTRALTLINSGLIQGDILFSGEGDTLEVSGNSQIEGQIIFGGGADTLIINNLADALFPQVIDFGTGDDTLVFNGSPDLILNVARLENLEGSSQTYFRGGDVIASFNPTVFSLADEMLTDLLNSLHGSVRDYLNSHYVNPDKVKQSQWIQVFGGRRSQKSKGLDLEANHNFGGMLGGFDIYAGASRRLGFIFGGSTNMLEIGDKAQELKSDSFVMGAYASQATEKYLLGGSFITGFTFADIFRSIDAIDPEIARGHQRSIFVSPELSIALRGKRNFISSASLRYAGLFQSAYTESGSSVNFSFGDRNLHFIQTRAQLSIPYADKTRSGKGFWALEGRLGVDGRFNFGFSGMPVKAFHQKNNYQFYPKKNTLSGFLGAFTSYNLDSKLNLNGSIEASYFEGGSSSLSGNLSLRINF